MRILYVGDVVGRSGRAILLDRLPELKAAPKDPKAVKDFSAWPKCA